MNIHVNSNDLKVLDALIKIKNFFNVVLLMDDDQFTIDTDEDGIITIFFVERIPSLHLMNGFSYEYKYMSYEKKWDIKAHTTLMSERNAPIEKYNSVIDVNLPSNEKNLKISLEKDDPKDSRVHCTIRKYIEDSPSVIGELYETHKAMRKAGSCILKNMTHHFYMPFYLNRGGFTCKINGFESNVAPAGYENILLDAVSRFATPDRICIRRMNDTVCATYGEILIDLGLYIENRIVFNSENQHLKYFAYITIPVIHKNSFYLHELYDVIMQSIDSKTCYIDFYRQDKYYDICEVFIYNDPFKSKKEDLISRIKENRSIVSNIISAITDYCISIFEAGKLSKRDVHSGFSMPMIKDIITKKTITDQNLLNTSLADEKQKPI